jgi:hypothetical protein
MSDFRAFMRSLLGAAVADRVFAQTAGQPRPAPQRNFHEFVQDMPPQPLAGGPPRGFVRDPAYEASDGVRDALSAIDNGSLAVVVLGRAGTGKTRLVQYLRGRPGSERQAVVAPTAIAALNAKAQTIHSMFRLPPRVLDARNLPGKPPPDRLFRYLTRLVVDKVSMVRADLLDAVDARLREARADPRPFGGVQVVMVGDFLQLPPVVDDEAMDVLHGLGYRAPFAFCAHIMSRLPATPVLLDRVYRQEERDFVEALARVRRAEDAAGAIALLNERCFRPHRDGRVPLLLTPTRAEAERHNRAGLAALSGSPTEYRAVVEGELKLDKDRLPAPELLVLDRDRPDHSQGDPGLAFAEPAIHALGVSTQGDRGLKNGARVMAVQNDSQRRESTAPLAP